MPPADTTPMLHHASTAFPAGARLHVLPDRRRARLVVEAGSPRQRWRESAWLPAYRWSAKLLRWGIRIRFAVRPGRFTACPSADGAAAQESHAGCGEHGLQCATALSGAVGPQAARSPGLRVVVRIGTADARQKLTRLIVDERGQLVRVAKVGYLPLALRLVQHEAVVLRALPEGIGPKLLWAGNIVDGAPGTGGRTPVSSAGGSPAEPGNAVVFEPVQGKGLPARLPRSPSGPSWREVDAFLARLAAAAGPETSRAGARGVAADRHPGLVALRDGHPRASDWIASLSGHAWPVTIEHGDFAPWNLLRTTEGLRAIDWEDARLEGFPGFDLVHFVIQTGVLMHHWTAERVRHYAEERLQDTGLTAQQAGAVVKLAALRDYGVTPDGEQGTLQGIRAELMDG